jgi:hypothetical protein
MINAYISVPKGGYLQDVTKGYREVAEKGSFVKMSMFNGFNTHSIYAFIPHFTFFLLGMKVSKFMFILPNIFHINLFYVSSSNYQ